METTASRVLTLQDLREFFAPLFAGTGGIDSWLTGDVEGLVTDRLGRISREHLTLSQLNQLLLLSHEANLSAGFFQYYWLEAPGQHPWDLSCAGEFKAGLWNVGAPAIVSLEHLKWGFERFYIDALLYFGNIRSAYRTLREFSYENLISFFVAKRFPEEAMLGRGPALSLKSIPRDDRYLISEMACKSYQLDGDVSQIEAALLELYRRNASSAPRQVREIVSLSEGRQSEFQFSAAEMLDAAINTEDDLRRLVRPVATRFARARDAALVNTRLYLSAVNELDVYVATSMRSRDDFRAMAAFCDSVFHDEKLERFALRYFDPTLSAAAGHEDKGLIECLMVKSAKVLIYSAGARDSYGKDAEAAMALSLGKPVIFHCDEELRSRFYREVHPLSRLIQFSTGLAVGAMVVSTLSDVVMLLSRLFTNRMRYRVLQTKPGHLRLVEERSDCIVRLQTGDGLLRETLWNYYRGERGEP